MIELLDATRENDVYAATVRLEIDRDFHQERFGMPVPDYSNLKRILEFRPFENTGVALYRYFFCTGICL